MTTKTNAPMTVLSGTYDNLYCQERQLYVDGVCVGVCHRFILENYPCLVRDAEWRDNPWGHFPDIPDIPDVPDVPVPK